VVTLTRLDPGECVKGEPRPLHVKDRHDRPAFGTSLTVQVMYGQSGGPANDTTRGIKNIKATYGYPDAYTYQLSDGTDVWVRNIA
jgi:hypothetical protein